MRKTFLVLLVLGLSLSVLVTVSAQEFIKVGQTINGTLSEATMDYNISLSGEQTVVIELSSPDFDTLIIIRDGVGNDVGYDDDGGSGLNSRLVFIAPADGIYTIVVGGLGGPVTGSYTLSAGTFELLALPAGTPVSVELTTESSSAYFSFQGTAGQVVDISAFGNTTLDTTLTLTGEDTMQIAYDDDGGEGYNPYIRHAVLPVDGTYTVTLAAYSSDTSGTVNVLMEFTTLTMLGKGPVTVTFGENMSLEVLGLEAITGTTYRMTIESTDGRAGSPYIEISGTDGYYYTSASGSNVSRLVFDFTADSSVIYSVSIGDYGTASYIITAEAMN